VADLIAAGEVVERPASVVKELVENALDAGATAITLEIKGGGLTYIRVTDNGSGMEKSDAETAFLRHATSKLATGQDLEAIGTLGFRGEALAAIAAVSRIDLLTCQSEAGAGTGVTVEAGRVTDVSPAGCPVGTTIIVRDLFFNTPARLKFMKSDKAEGAAITAMLVSSALSHPGVSFRYIKDEKEEYHTPGDGQIRSAIYTLLGRTFAKSLVEVDNRGEEIAVSGFVTAPEESRGNRGHQYFFVNGRQIRSKFLAAALERAYQNTLLSGKFPGCILYLALNPRAVDVNVHPAKTEVKFLYEKEVFDAVYYSVLAALDQSTHMPEISLSKGTQRVLDAPPPPVSGGSKASDTQPPPLSDPGTLRDTAAVVYQSRFPLPDASPAPPPIAQTALPLPTSNSENKAPAPPEKSPAPSDPAEIASEMPPYRVIGEALGTYILVEQGDTLLFIDKHAAHERILFAALQSEDYAPMPQILLEPIIVDLGPQITATLAEHAGYLAQFGFELDQFGLGTVAVRQVPEEIDLDHMEPFLSELAEKLIQGQSPDLQEIRDDIRHTIACKAAIKAGRRSDPLELHQLAGRVLAGEVKYCPHGRPISFCLSRAQLDKQVKRV